VPENHPVGFGEETTVTVKYRWTRRLLAAMRVDPAGDPSESTLEKFFAGVRWSEDHHADGLTTLRRSSL